MSRPVASLLLLVASASGSLLACSSDPPRDDKAYAKILWRNCTACHGDDGSGDRLIGAPAISGLPAWYVEAQLLKFRSGQRGGHFDDITGMRMRPMSLALNGDKEVAIVAAHVETLAKTRKPRVLDGDREKGKIALNTCAACHGQAGEGNKAMRAPPLVKQDDWYLLAQLQKFKAGIRGTNPADASGATMRPMAMTLADEKAMRDVIAAIQGLEN